MVRNIYNHYIWFAFCRITRTQSHDSIQTAVTHQNDLKIDESTAERDIVTHRVIIVLCTFKVPNLSIANDFECQSATDTNSISMVQAPKLRCSFNLCTSFT